jgi:hypothetical protein
MVDFLRRLGILPFLLLGIALLLLGLLALNHIVNNFWPFDVQRLDLIRATATGRVDAPTLLEAVNLEILLAFLASVMVSVTGLILPFIFILNKRFYPPDAAPSFLVIVRQAMWVGVWIAFCVWLQMNRTLGLAVVLLVAAVLAMFEVLLQVRTRASTALD